MLGKKYLIASGCSFTQGHHLFNEGSWANYFSKNNNLELINLGKGGAGNQYIINNTIQYSIINKEIADNAIFGIQLSEVLRTLVCLDFPDTFDYPKYTHITPVQFIQEQTFSNWDLTIFHNKWIYDNRYKLAPFFMNITNSVSITINAIISFINFCEKNNYPYFIFDGINTNIPEKVKNGWALVGEAEIDNHVVNVIEEQQSVQEFMNTGNPIIYKSIIDYINGIPNYIKDIHYKQYMLNVGTNNHNDFDFYLRDNEGHPNKEGAKLWAKYLQNKVEEIFVKTN
jgi:hypothetical protein